MPQYGSFSCKIGNSKGIRLSKTLIERYNIKDSVELVPEKDQIIIRPLTKPRRNWGTAFREMNANGDDHLLVSDVFEDESLEATPISQIIKNATKPPKH